MHDVKEILNVVAKSVYIQPSPRVAGLGWGLFSCLIIGSCLLLLCLGLSGEDAAG